jgi:hypothetical protein
VAVGSSERRKPNARLHSEALGCDLTAGQESKTEIPDKLQISCKIQPADASKRFIIT